MWSELMEACSGDGVVFAQYGNKNGGGRGSRRAAITWGTSRIGSDFGCACRRGEKEPANQDNYFFLESDTGDFVAGVMDGHGGKGHRYSECAAWWLPVFIRRHPSFRDDIGKTILDAFERMSGQLRRGVASTLPENEVSGSTCVVVARRGAELHIAHLGDSAAALYGDRVSEMLNEDRCG
jgi:serine/threonine protein phosphatase PrpC